jgi:hypothetical protein
MTTAATGATLSDWTVDSKGETTAGGVSDDRDPPRTAFDEAAVGRLRVVQGGRESVLRG